MTVCAHMLAFGSCRDCAPAARATIADETIEAGIALAGTIPELVEWHGDPAHRVTIRVEVHIGKYAEGSLYPDFTAEDVAETLRGLSRRLTPEDH